MTTPMSTLPRYYRRLVKETAQAAYRKGVEEGQRLATSAVLAGMFEGLNGDGERVALKALAGLVAKSGNWDEGKHPRDHGRFSSKPGGQGGDAAPAPVRLPKPPVAKPATSKHLQAARGLRSPARRRRVIKAVKNEAELAAAIGGYHLPDSEPADVAHVGGDKPFAESWHFREYLRHRESLVRRLKELRRGSAEVGRFSDPSEASRIEHHLTVEKPLHFFEVKTLLTSPDSAVHMSRAARARKERWADRYAAQFHTVAFDDRRGGKHSGHRVHVAPGELGGTMRLEHMKRADDLSSVLGHVS